MTRDGDAAEVMQACCAYEKELTALRAQSATLPPPAKDTSAGTDSHTPSKLALQYANLHGRILSYAGATSAEGGFDWAARTQREADELDHEVQELEERLRQMQNYSANTEETAATITPPRGLGGGCSASSGVLSGTMTVAPSALSPSCTALFMPHVDSTTRATHASLSPSPVISTSSSTPVLLPTLSRNPFAAFGSQLAELCAHLTTAQLVFRSILAHSLEELRDGRVSASDVRLADPALWRAKEQLLQRMLTEVSNKACALQARNESASENSAEGQGGAACERAEVDPVAYAAEMLTEVQDLAAAATEHLRRGSEMRQRRDAQLRIFVEECSRLTTWCRQQHANLDAMQSSDHLQEYCATLAENYPAMCENISFLLTTVWPFVESDNATVRAALSELSELWFCLQVTAMERLARTLYEVHPCSFLEAECERYAGFGADVWSYVRDMQTLLDDVHEQRRRGHATSKSRRAGNVSERCSPAEEDQSDEWSDRERTNDITTNDSSVNDNDKNEESVNDNASDLQARRSEGAILLQSLATCGPQELHGAMRLFAQRVRVVRAGFQCLRDAALTRLTFLASTTDIVARSKQRQIEFEDCVTRLRKWAKAAAHGESWRDIYTKIVDIKRLIKQEQGELEERDEQSGIANA